MKVELTSNQLVFKPITIQLTFETQAEYDCFMSEIRIIAKGGRSTRSSFDYTCQEIVNVLGQC